ncbi:hypothetical protein [Paenibacillus sp. DMB5]|uniref:hypothetical protein n=1 Tax=Paenibacillus sp. DMB5 TaxID=1780103 RepID=UPI00076C5F6E|nr:hypothetical protein [Paenibacillus sp. DMB5]KUP25788.1 hypothetical protein AWJ19_19380 [Paenibacillus sp. DMB5]
MVPWVHVIYYVDRIRVSNSKEDDVLKIVWHVSSLSISIEDKIQLFDNIFKELCSPTYQTENEYLEKSKDNKHYLQLIKIASDILKNNNTK